MPVVCNKFDGPGIPASNMLHTTASSPKKTGPRGEKNKDSRPKGEPSHQRCATQSAKRERFRPSRRTGKAAASQSRLCAACSREAPHDGGASCRGHLSRKRQVRYHGHARRYGSMAEQRFCKPWVGGSTPSTGSRLFFEAAARPRRGLASFGLRTPCLTCACVQLVCMDTPGGGV